MSGRMPLPDVKPNEDEQTYVSRCIAYEKRQDTDLSDERIAAACYDKYRKTQKSDIDLHETSKEELVELGKKIFKEIAKRKSNGEMDWTISEDKSETYQALWDEVKKELTDKEIEILTTEIKESAEPSQEYYSKAKPAKRGYRQELEENIKSIGWDDERLLVDVKVDGLRVSAGNANGAFVIVDPEELKEAKSDRTDKVPAIAEELKSFPDGTVFDAEFYVAKENKAMHRTTANALIRADDPKEFTDYCYLFVFDILFDEGKDVRNYPLKERIELLSKYDDTKHIDIEHPSTNIEKGRSGYITEDTEEVKEATELIMDAKHSLPKNLEEGVMVKKLKGEYKSGSLDSWMKIKKSYEIDLRVLEKDSVKNNPGVYNYTLGMDITEDYFDTLVNMDTKEWYHSVGKLSGDEFYRGKKAKEHDGQPIMVMGKSDNHKEKEDIEIGDIIRIASEEVLKYKNPEHPDYPRYSFYIGIVMENIPEKESTDDLEVAEKLSQFQPQRIPKKELKTITNPESSSLTIEDILDEIKIEIDKESVKKAIAKLEEFKSEITSKADITKEDVKKWLEDQNIPEEVYNKIAKEDKPLPEICYTDYDETNYAYAQYHIRGCIPEEVEKWKNGELSLSEIIEGHSIHCLTGDTRIFARDLYGRVNVKKIRRLASRTSNEFPEVLTRDGWKKVKAFIKSKKKVPVYSIKLRNGVEFKATADHPHFVLKNLGWNGELQRWRMFKTNTLNLNEGDALLYTDGYEGNNIGDYNFGRFLGLFAGDGTSAIDHVQFIFAEDEIDYCEFVEKYTSEIGAYTHRFHDSEKKAWRVNCFSQGIIQVVKDYINKDKSFTWRVWRLSKNARKGILDGMWEANGRKNTSSYNVGVINEKLRDQLTYIAASIGEKYTIRDYFYGKEEDELTENRIIYNMNKNEKYNYPKRFLENAVKIESVRKLPKPRFVYDLTVNDNPEFTLANGMITHNCDLRQDYGDDKFIQWVLTQDQIPDYFDTLKGDLDPDTGNVSKGLGIVKPSALEGGPPEEESEEPHEVKKEKEEDLIIGEEQANTIANYDMSEVNDNFTFVIPAGNVGATSEKDSIMMTIWKGQTKPGVQRRDCHEYFFYPDDIPDKNKELLNGRFLVRAFRPGGDERWWIWKADEDPKPMDSLEHADIGHYWPIPAKELEDWGHEDYLEESKEKFKEALD